MESNYKVLELTTSTREEILKAASSDDKISTVECYLVVHCLFDSPVGQLSIDHNVYKIATKNYDDQGNLTVTPGSGGIPDYDSLMKMLAPVIEARIKSVEADQEYNQLVRSAAAVGETKLSKYYRDSPTGYDTVPGVLTL